MNADHLNEDDVVGFFVAHLEHEGWEILQALRARQRGIDVVAFRNGLHLYAEAKGAVSVHRGTALADPYASTASALMQAAAIRHLTGDAVVAIVLPETKEYHYHVSAIARALAMARIEAWLVDGLGVVRGAGAVASDLAWPAKKLPTFERGERRISASTKSRCNS